MRPYSVDLRERVIAMIQTGEMSQPQIAHFFQISLGTVENWWRRWRETGNLAPTVFTPGPERTLQGYAQTLRACVQSQPDATLQELCERIQEQHHVQVSPGTMSRELKRLKLPRKKVFVRQPAHNRTRPNITRRTSSQNREHIARSRRTPEIHR